jgi:RHS repeat-associated protein
MAKANALRFSTKYQDDETELLYYGVRYLTTSSGSWLGRDPINEKGGLNLYNCFHGDPCNTIDYLGLVTGTVTVDESHETPDFWAIGWVIKLRWTPPASWKGLEPQCMPCQEAVWIQDRKYDIEHVWWDFWNKDVHTGWGKDWDETDYAGSALQWIALSRWSHDSTTMHDHAEVGPSFKIKSVFFDAIAKVKCLAGQDAGKIYATVKWGYHDFVAPNGGGSMFGGGYTIEQ